MSVGEPCLEPLLVDAGLEDRIRSDGFAIIRLLDPEDAAEIGHRIARAYQDPIEPNQVGSNWFFGLLDEDRERANASAELVWKRVVPVLEPLFAGARCHYASVALKGAGAGPTPMHQHWPSTVDPYARRIGCWVLLSSGGGSTSFRLVPRSHQLLPFIRHEGSEDYFGSFSDAVDRTYARDVEVKDGEAILFEDSLLHGTSANEGPRLRVAALANFIGSDMKPARIVPEADGNFAILCPVDEEPTSTKRPLGRPPSVVRKVGTLPNRNRTISEEEFRQLLALGRKASLAFDPLGLVREPAAPAGETAVSQPGLVQRLRRAVARLWPA